MDQPLSNKLSELLTLDVIELIGDDACLAINEMQNRHEPESKIISYIEKKMAEMSGQLETGCVDTVMDTIRKSHKYQADFIMLKKHHDRTLPVRLARNKCLEHVGLRGYALMEDSDIARVLRRNKDIRLTAKALVVRDFIKQAYDVELDML
jgi:hypothetical protein